MSFFKEISEEFKKEIFWVILFDILFFIAPGFLGLFIFYRDLFINLDVIKLILLALSISSPFVFLNTIFVWIISNIKFGEKNEDENMFLSATISLIITNILFDFIFLFNYFFAFSLRNSLIMLIILEIIIIIFFIVLMKKSNKK